jgi:hypothetical protein
MEVILQAQNLLLQGHYQTGQIAKLTLHTTTIFSIISLEMGQRLLPRVN